MGPSPRGRGSLDHVRQIAGVQGPSPRGRGSPGGDGARAVLGGSIPAWAGKPSRPGKGEVARWVHPRVGGEAGVYGRGRDGSRGPSPRGRGSLWRTSSGRLWQGSIPAWAGKPPHEWAVLDADGVHPRVGGEAAPDGGDGGRANGPSPRGRGSHGSAGRPRARRGSIPAWAGKPRIGGQAEGEARVHPRVGGEAISARSRVRPCEGPSPRGRGSRDPVEGLASRRGSIPAWAGKPGYLSRVMVAPGVHPRVGGEASTMSA